MVAAARPPGISARLLGSGALGRDALFQVGQQQHQRGRGHAVEPGRLAEGRRPVALELLAHSVDRPGSAAKSKSAGMAMRLVLAEGRDVELLPLDIDGVAGVDLELRGDGRSRCLPISGQIGGEPRDIDAGIGQQLEGRAPAAVAIDARGRAGRPRWASASGSRSSAAPSSSAADLRGEGRCAVRSDAAEVDAERRQALVGIVGAQAQPVFGARGEHAVGLGDAARHQVVDHHAEIAVGAARRRNRAAPPPASARR